MTDTSDLMNIKTLEKEYNAVLKQYEEAYKNCNAKLNAMVDDTSTTTKTFTSFPNNSFWGTDSLKEGSVASQIECESMCASDPNCSGATYNPDKKYCWARKGYGTLAVSINGSTDIALIPDVKACMITLKSLNNRLLEINQQLTNAISTSTSQVESQQTENLKKSDELHKYYAQLLAERLQMDQLVKENETVNAKYENQSLSVNQASGTLRFWTVIACVLVIIVLNQMRGKRVTFFSIFWLLIMISLIVLSFSINNISGFLVWSILILIIILMKMGIIPSPEKPVVTV